MRTALRAAALAAFALVTLARPGAAQAGPADEVVSPVVEQGEIELDLKSGLARLRDGGGREQQHTLGLGYGATSFWATEVYAVWHKEPGARTRFEAWEWENRFQLTETGRYPVDLGLLLEVERPRERSEGYELRWGPLLQADLSPSVQANLNLLVEKHVRAAEASKAELGYQWQLKYRWKRELEFGLQGLGDVGPWNHWEPASEQPHQAGPAIFGQVKMGPGHGTVKYNAALLLGMTHGAPKSTLRAQAEFEL